MPTRLALKLLYPCFADSHLQGVGPTTTTAKQMKGIARIANDRKSLGNHTPHYRFIAPSVTWNMVFVIHESLSIFRAQTSVDVPKPEKP